jgi:hypothetical protein
MLLYRDDLISHRPGGNHALQAALRVTRIAEELLADEMIKYSQLYLYVNLPLAPLINCII